MLRWGFATNSQCVIEVSQDLRSWLPIDAEVTETAEGQYIGTFAVRPENPCFFRVRALAP